MGLQQIQYGPIETLGAVREHPIDHLGQATGQGLQRVPRETAR
jgi:hypothetical protein